MTLFKLWKQDRRSRGGCCLLGKASQVEERQYTVRKARSERRRLIQRSDELFRQHVLHQARGREVPRGPSFPGDSHWMWMSKAEALGKRRIWKRSSHGV